MTFSLMLLITVVVAAVSTAAFVLVVGRQRKEVLSRVDGRGGSVRIPPGLLLEPEESLSSRLASWLSERMADSWSENAATTTKLIQAGFDSNTAPVIYTAARLAFGLVLPALAFALGAASTFNTMLLYVGFAGAVGVLGPPAVLDRLAERRRGRIRHGLPDALDLLVVCVEAGVSLDAAILRVARDLAITHPDLAGELMGVNRRVNAGLPREKVLTDLWTRTGVEELRGLASSMVQCEKWGTSIAKVLRISAETLRRKRKQLAEKKAAEAGVKMLIPLMVFLLPALFVVILGPAIMRVAAAFAEF
jgi:tight adherence protein C